MTRPLSAGIIINVVAVFQWFSARWSSFVKLLSGMEADCTVDAVLLLMLCLAARFL